MRTFLLEKWRTINTSNATAHNFQGNNNPMLLENILE